MTLMWHWRALQVISGPMGLFLHALAFPASWLTSFKYFWIFLFSSDCVGTFSLMIWCIYCLNHIANGCNIYGYEVISNQYCDDVWRGVCGVVPAQRPCMRINNDYMSLILAPFTQPAPGWYDGGREGWVQYVPLIEFSTLSQILERDNIRPSSTRLHLIIINNKPEE